MKNKQTIRKINKNILKIRLLERGWIRIFRGFWSILLFTEIICLQGQDFFLALGHSYEFVHLMSPTLREWTRTTIDVLTVAWMLVIALGRFDIITWFFFLFLIMLRVFHVLAHVYYRNLGIKNSRYPLFYCHGKKMLDSKVTGRLRNRTSVLNINDVFLG